MKDDVLLAGGFGRSASSEMYNCSFEGDTNNLLNSECILGISANDMLMLAENLHLGIFMAGQDERLCLVNDAFMGWTGLSCPISGISVTSLIHPDDADHYLSVHRNVLKGQRGYTQAEFKIRSKKSEFLSVNITMTTIVLGSSCVVLNMVNWKNDLKETNFIQGMVDAYPEIAALVDSRYRVIAVNDLFTNKLGTTKDNILGNEIIHFAPKDVADKRKAILDKVLQTGRPYRFTDTFQNDEFEYFLTPIKDDKSHTQYILILCKNITDLVHAENSINLLSRQLLTAIEEERKKIAYDLHDECGQLVAVVAMGLSTLKNSLPDNLKQSRAMCDSFTGIIEKLSDKIRSMSTELHPDMIDHCGLVPAIVYYLETVFNGVPSITCHFQSNVDKKSFGPQVDIVLYRIIQESLNNVIKHSKADRVDVELQFENRVLCLKVQDNGIGFDQNRQAIHTSHHCMGILGMMERAATIDGLFSIDSQPQKGTSVTVTLSVPKDRL